MDATAWIIVAVVAVLVLGGVAYAATRGRERRRESHREEAGVLRERAQVRAAQAERHEAVAEERAREAEEKARDARREREAAQATARQADDVDPDVETSR